MVDDVRQRRGFYTNPFLNCVYFGILKRDWYNTEDTVIEQMSLFKENDGIFIAFKVVGRIILDI